MDFNGFTNRLNMAKEKFSELEEMSISRNCGIITEDVIHIVGAPGEEREKGREIFEATMSEHFQKLMIDDKPHLQEAQRTTSRVNVKTKQNKKPTRRHIIFRFQKSKDNEKVLKPRRRDM